MYNIEQSLLWGDCSYFQGNFKKSILWMNGRVLCLVLGESTRCCGYVLSNCGFTVCGQLKAWVWGNRVREKDNANAR
ncbi:hypothetical protein MNBD_GAMMA08-2092 [hydrothermal vent metagenome]|uniref:Uncharacterized protein n=1 Tax=hydrothermal vent metagenome TaxID=652676 RepID=A0A3B0X7R7_9ZZZZ